MRRQEREQARKYFAAAAELDSQSFLVHFYAAELAYDKMDSNSAEDHLRKALAINPDFAPACRNLSQILVMQESRLQEALELARKAMDLEPSDLAHRFNVGSILIKMGNLEEASKQAETLRALARNEVERSLAESLRSMIQDRRQAMIGEKQRGDSLKEHPQKTEEQLRKEGETAKQLQKEIEDWNEQMKAGPIKTGAAGKVAGLVRSVKCSYPSVMDLVIATNGKQQKLRAQNYYQVKYWAVGAPGESALKPCEELEGKRVEIEFLSVSGREFSGLIQTIAIEK